MPFYPVHLEPFLILLLLPVLGFVAWKSLTVESGARKWAAFGIRAAVLLLLVLALADLRFADVGERLSVMFLVDHSASIPPEERDRSLERVRKALEGLKDGDRAGLVIFGSNASIESMPEEKPSFQRISSVINADYTDIGNALRLASASFPQGSQRRLVLVSDGNENTGNAVEEARRAWASGVSTDVMPVSYSYGSEVQVERLVLPPRVKKGETFEARLIITSTKDTTAKIFITLDRALINEPKPLKLSAGKNVLVHSMRLDEPGFYSFTGRVEPEADTVPGNNLGSAFTIVEGEPRVLCIGPSEDVSFVSEALVSQGIQCRTVGPESAPASAAGFQSFDCVFLCNVPSSTFSKQQMEALSSSVTNFGLGLVMVGGDQSFGAGGYFKTPIEDVLPVSCEIKQKKILPNGALVLIMHTCEFEDGNFWAKNISRKAVERLTPEDLVGIVYFRTAFSAQCVWLFDEKLIPAADKEGISKQIGSLNPGDMPTFDDALRMAYGELKDVKASKKHVVIISDGDPSPPSSMLVSALSRTSIAVSTVLIGPHSNDGNAERVMSELAEATGGRYYKAAEAMELPAIITTVARTVSSNFIKEEVFTPIRASNSEILKGFAEGEFPTLAGRVVTSAKQSAEIALRTPDGDPLFAHWRAGLGRSAAFTSDAKNRWASDWVVWQGFNKFWGQTARWCMRTVPQNNLSMHAAVTGRKGSVTLDALDQAGRFLNYLKAKAKAVTPSFREIPVEVSQKGPGRYEGAFEADEVGSYFLSLSYEGEGISPGFMTTGASLSYPPEYQDLSANAPLLEAVAEAGGGRILADSDDVFLHNLPTSAGMEPKWHIFVIAAMILFFADVFYRRVSIPFGRIAGLAASAAGRARAMVSRTAPPAPPAESMNALLRRKAEVADALTEAPPPPVFEASGPTAEVDLDRPQHGPAAQATAPPPAAPEPAEGRDAAYIKRLLDAKKKAFDKKEKERKMTDIRQDVTPADLAGFSEDFRKVKAEIQKVIVGYSDVIDHVLVALFSGGHCLLEGVPGLGKTMLVRAMSRSLDLEFSRIQFTPDLMPADIIGTDIVVDDGRGSKSFAFQKGPVFASVLLADEINRATPKTQSALLEAMQESSVTVGRQTYALPNPFIVLATQNPIEMEGTYPLPEAQLDRFFFKIIVAPPSRDDLNEITKRTTGSGSPESLKVLDGARINGMKRIARAVIVADHVRDYASRVVLASHPGGESASPLTAKYIRYGSSPRGAQALIMAGKVRAILDGRTNVAFADISGAAKHALRHRLILNFEGEAEGIGTDAVIEDILRNVKEYTGR